MTEPTSTRSTLPGAGRTYEPDYDFWKAKDGWLLPEAAKLICGRDPVQRFPSRPIFNRSLRVLDVIDQAFAAIRAGEMGVLRDALIPNHVQVEPASFISWAQSAGLEIPPPFCALLDVEVREEVKDVLAEERAVAVGRTLWSVDPSLSVRQIRQHQAFETIVGRANVSEERLRHLLRSYLPTGQSFPT